MKKMRKSFYIFGLCGAVALGVFLGGLRGLGASANPGSPADPLVTRSYVHQAIYQALSGHVSSYIPSYTSGHATFAPVQLLAGQLLLGGEGSEIILRSGQAVAHVPGSDGIVDISAGADLFAHDEISSNHFLIIPRADGRGVFAVTDAWFLVKGDYQIVVQ